MFDFLDIFLKMIAFVRFLSCHLPAEQVVSVCASGIVAAITFVSVMEYKYRTKMKIH